MSEKAFIVGIVAVLLILFGFMLPVITKSTEQREKYNQCIIEYAREVPDLKTFCNSMSRI